MPHKTDVHVGGKVREARILNRLTQSQLGDKLGISFQQVQKYERGTNRIGASRLHDIANTLRVSVAFFFEGLSDKKPIEEKISRTALYLAKELDDVSDDRTRDLFLTLLKKYYS